MTGSTANDIARETWWSPRIERAVLKGLMRRTDAHGLAFLAGWALLLVACGLAIHATRGTFWVALAVVAYGFVLGDSVAVTGWVKHVNGLTENDSTGVVTVTQLGPASVPPEPLVVMSEGRSAFRVDDLLQLVALIHQLDSRAGKTGTAEV